MRRADVTLPSGLRLATWDRTPEHETGAPFVLVHGLSSNSRLWDGVAETLARLGHRSVAVDLRGHGGSDKPDDGYDVATVAEDVRQLAEAMTLDRPVAVGQSWGGNVVLELAVRWGEGLRGIACIDGGTIDLQSRYPEWEAAEAALAPPRLDGTPLEDLERHLRAMHPDWPEAGIRGSLENVEVRDDGTVSPWLTFERHLVVLRGLWEHRPSTRFAQVGVPTLLIPARAEGATGWDVDRRASVERAATEIPTAKVHWMTGDHDLHAQHPATLAGILHDATKDLFLP